MKKLPLTIASAALLLAAGAHAQNVWNGAGVTDGTGNADWTAAANYTGTPTFSATTDLKFSTITNASGGVTLTAGTGGTYAVRGLYFGDDTTAGSGQTTAQFITMNGTGTAGQTTLDLAGNIYVSSPGGSIAKLGSDLTLNLSDGAHSVMFRPNANVTTPAGSLTLPVLVVDALITGGGTGTKFVNTYSRFGPVDQTNNASPVIIFANNNNSFVAVQNRFDTQVGFTSIANVGGGNSAMGNATTAATGTISMGNGSYLNYIGSGNQTTDRNLNLGSGNSLGNSSTGTTLTYNGLMTPANGVTLRANVISGSSLVINSVLADVGAGTITIVKNGSTSYFNAAGVSATNDGGGTLVLGGNNTFAGAVTVTGGTLRTDHANALGSTAGATTVGNGATLDIHGQAIGAEAVGIRGVGVGGAGALVNTSATKASLSGNVTMAANTTIGGTGDITLGGVVAGNAFALTKLGAGQLTLNGVNTYTGTTTVSAGALGGIGSISTGAVTFATGTTLNPGDGATTGQFSFGGNLTLNNDAIFSVSLNQAAGNGYDRVAVAGTTNITGSILAVALGANFDSTAQTGQTFNILTSAGALTGQFDQGSSITATSGAATYSFGISYTGNIVT
ncbi:MAG: autotransporter-associated beta strand repeat-containing protein, partial [Rariglobus sp.]